MFEKLVSRLQEMGLDAEETSAFAGQYNDGADHGEYFSVVRVETDSSVPFSFFDSIVKRLGLAYEWRSLWGRGTRLYTIWRVDDLNRARALESVARAFLEAFWGEQHRQYIASGRNDGILPGTDVNACIAAGRAAIENMEV